MKNKKIIVIMIVAVIAIIIGTIYIYYTKLNEKILKLPEDIFKLENLKENGLAIKWYAVEEKK